MKYYAVAELSISDPSWARDYVAKVTPMVERFGGRYLARTNRIERLEGQRENPHVFMMIEWPSKEAALAFYASEEYRPFLASRRAGSEGEFVLVAGEDMNRAARMSEG
jgi:uncharacterized protein (DUF1330 family)